MAPSLNARHIIVSTELLTVITTSALLRALSTVGGVHRKACQLHYLPASCSSFSMSLDTSVKNRASGASILAQALPMEPLAPTMTISESQRLSDGGTGFPYRLQGSSNGVGIACCNGYFKAFCYGRPLSPTTEVKAPRPTICAPIPCAILQAFSILPGPTPPAAEHLLRQQGTATKHPPHFRLEILCRLFRTP